MQHAERARRAERVVVRGRQRGEIDAALAQPADARAFAHAVQVVVVRARDQLRRAGAAARQLQERDVARGRFGRQRDVRRRVGQRKVRIAGGGKQHVAQRRRVGLHVARERPVIEPVVTFGRDVRDRLRVPAEVADLATAMRGQREHRQRAETEQRERDREERDAVRQLHHHAVARRDAARGQRAGDARRFVGECAIRPADVVLHERDALAMPLDALVEPVRERLPAPIPVAAVRVGERVRPGCAVRAHHARSVSASAATSRLTPSASSIVRNFAAVSARSPSGVDSPTTPAPA